MQEHLIYHYIFQNLPRQCGINKIMGQNILKCAIIEVKDDGITKVKMIIFIFVTYGHVVYVTFEIVVNCSGESVLFIYRYRAIIL